MRAGLGALALLALAGCDWSGPRAAPQPEQIDPAATATPEYTPPPPSTPSPGESAAPAVFPIDEDRDPAVMVDGCEDARLKERPEGSNCYGFFPEQCGADKAAAFTGRTATPELRDRLRDLAPRRNARFLLPSEREGRRRVAGRLTVKMTQSGKINEVDCY